MKSQTLFLLLALLAVLARDAHCARNESDEDEPDENEPDENEGHKRQPALPAPTKSVFSASGPSATLASAAVTPLSAVASIVPPALPTASFSDAAISGAAAVSSAVASGIASDVPVIQSSVISAASSWAASVGIIPSATFGVSSKPAAPSVSAARPYAGPSVISESNRIEVSSAIATVGILAFLLTLA